jgi:hypothetical protein
MATAQQERKITKQPSNHQLNKWMENKTSAAFEPVLGMLEEYKAYGQCIAILNEMVPSRYHQDRGVSVIRDDLLDLHASVAREIKIERKCLIVLGSMNEALNEALKELFRNPDFNDFALGHSRITDDGR